MSTPIDQLAEEITTAEEEIEEVTETPEPQEEVVEETPEVAAEEDDTTGGMDAPPPEEEEEPEKPPKGYVPHGAMHAERAERIKAQEELTQLKAQYQAGAAEMQKQFDALKAQVAPEKPEEVPEYLEDPQGYVEELEKRGTEKIAALEQRQAQAEQQRQMETAIDFVKEQSSTQEATYVKDHPDYYQALHHRRMVAASNMKSMNLTNPDGSPISDQQIRQAVFNEEIQLAAREIQAGRNPADLMYVQAKNAGYRIAKAEGDGVDPADVTKLETVERGQKANKGVKGGEGGGNAAAEEDFDEYEAAMKETFAFLHN